MKPLLILCLGNEIITDDRFGYEVAYELTNDANILNCADVIFAPVAGFGLLDILAGRGKVLIVDTIRTGMAASGTIHSFPAGTNAPSNHLTSSHQIDLPTALELGKRLGVEVPTSVEVIAIEAQDLETLSEVLTPPVRSGVGKAVQLIKQWISVNSQEERNYGQRKERTSEISVGQP